jgi:hypothetical protein
VALPVPYTGFGFYATNESVGAVATTGPGGVINSAGAVTINTGTTGDGSAYGAWSQGTGSQINFSGTTTITTAGAGSFGLYASGGGAITATAPAMITTTGANGVQADTGGVVKLSGGSAIRSGRASQHDLVRVRRARRLSGEQQHCRRRLRGRRRAKAPLGLGRVWQEQARAR